MLSLLKDHVLQVLISKRKLWRKQLLRMKLIFQILHNTCTGRQLTLQYKQETK